MPKEDIQKIMKDKLPKLQKYKQEGCQTVLLLEIPNHVLGHHLNIVEKINEFYPNSENLNELWIADTALKYGKYPSEIVYFHNVTDKIKICNNTLKA